MATLTDIPVVTPSRRRRLTAARLLPGLVCALFFVSGIAQTAIVPLLPVLAHRDGLSASASALLLSLPGIAMLAVSVPAGVLADRIGARRVTVLAGVLMVLGCAAQAAPSLPVLLLGRAEFGLAFGMLWTAGAAWLSALPEAGANGVGLAVICSSVGTMIGPGIGGVLAATRLPGDAPTGGTFALVTGLAVLATGALAACRAGARPTLRSARPPERERASEREPTSEREREHTGTTADFPAVETAISRPASSAPLRGLAGHVRSRRVAAAIGSLVVAGALSGATQLLIPAGLHSAGVPESKIGLIFSVCALGYILTSVGVVKLGARVRTLRVNAIVTALGAASLLPALLTGSPLALGAALMLTAIPRGAINVVAYGIAGSVESAGGSVFGMLNGAWGAATVLVPLAAGALVQHDGARAGYLAVIVPATAIAVGLAGGASGRTLRLPGRPGRDEPRFPTVAATPPPDFVAQLTDRD